MKSPWNLTQSLVLAALMLTSTGAFAQDARGGGDNRGTQATPDAATTVPPGTSSVGGAATIRRGPGAVRGGAVGTGSVAPDAAVPRGNAQGNVDVPVSAFPSSTGPGITAPGAPATGVTTPSTVSPSANAPGVSGGMLSASPRVAPTPARPLEPGPGSMGTGQIVIPPSLALPGQAQGTGVTGTAADGTVGQPGAGSTTTAPGVADTAAGAPGATDAATGAPGATGATGANAGAPGAFASPSTAPATAQPGTAQPGTAGAADVDDRDLAEANRRAEEDARARAADTTPQDPLPLEVSAGALADNPERLEGRKVTIRSRVADVKGAQVFTLRERGARAATAENAGNGENAENANAENALGEVIVVHPSPLSDSPKNDDVIVTGIVRPFSQDDVMRAYPWLATTPNLEELEGRPVVIAESVIQVE